MSTTESWNLFASLLCGVLILHMFTGCWAVTCPPHVANRRHSHTAVFRGTCYLFVNNERYWDRAKADCMRLGGEMLIVKDDATMTFIREQLNSKELSWDREGIWLGARHDSRTWRWTDGTKMTYSHWAPGEPSKFLGLYSPCVQMRADDNWQWHNKPCGSFAFHYNYVCQFPLTDSTTATTTNLRTTTTKLTTTKPHTTTTVSKYDVMLRDSKDLKSDLYSELGRNVYRLMMEEGVSRNNISLLLEKAIAAKKEDIIKHKEQGKSEEPGKSEDITNSSDEGRVSSAASNHEEDNGNTTILIIVLSFTAGFLIVTLIIFLIIRRHYLLMRQKSESNEVCYQNGASGIGMAVRRDPEDQPPSVPTSRPPPMNDLYLMPQEVTETYSQVNKPRNTTQNMNVQRNNLYPHMQEEPHNPPVTNSGQIGACGGIDADFDMKLPLISNGSPGSAEETLTRNGPTESCACHGSLGTDEYIDMRSMASLSNGKLKPDEDKHIYCNTHPRESTANENLYESLP